MATDPNRDLTKQRLVIAMDRALVTERLAVARSKTRDISARTDRLVARDSRNGYAELLRTLLEERR